MIVVAVYFVTKKPSANTTTISATASCPVGTDVVFSVDNSSASSGDTVSWNTGGLGTQDSTQSYPALVHDLLNSVSGSNLAQAGDRVALTTFNQTFGTAALPYKDVQSNNLPQIASQLSSTWDVTPKNATPDLLTAMKAASAYASANSRTDSNDNSVQKVVVMLLDGPKVAELSDAETYGNVGNATDNVQSLPANLRSSAIGQQITSDAARGVYYVFYTLNGPYTRNDSSGWANVFKRLYWWQEEPTTLNGGMTDTDYHNFPFTPLVVINPYNRTIFSDLNGHMDLSTVYNYVRRGQNNCVGVRTRVLNQTIDASAVFTIYFDYVNKKSMTLNNIYIHALLPKGVEYVSASVGSGSRDSVNLKNADGETSLTLFVGNVASGVSGSVMVKAQTSTKLYSANYVADCFRIGGFESMEEVLSRPFSSGVDLSSAQLESDIMALPLSSNIDSACFNSTDAAWSGAKFKAAVDFINSGKLRVYRVTDFGAKGDGVTDDTAAVQDAFEAARTNGGGVIYFSPGKTYLLSDTVGSATSSELASIVNEPDGLSGQDQTAARADLSNIYGERLSNTYVFGYGATINSTLDYTQLNWRDNRPVILLNGDNDVIAGLTITWKRPYSATVAESRQNMNGIFVGRSQIVQPNLLAEAANVVVADNTIDGAPWSAIMPSLVSDVVIKNNNISHDRATAIWPLVSASNASVINIAIDGNTITDSNDDCIFLTGITGYQQASNLQIENNHCTATGAKLIGISGVNGGTIAYNVLDSSSSFGIAVMGGTADRLLGSRNINIFNNTLNNTGQLCGASYDRLYPAMKGSHANCGDNQAAAAGFYISGGPGDEGISQTVIRDNIINTPLGPGFLLSGNLDTVNVIGNTVTNGHSDGVILGLNQTNTVVPPYLETNINIIGNTFNNILGNGFNLFTTNGLFLQNNVINYYGNPANGTTIYYRAIYVKNSIAATITGNAMKTTTLRAQMAYLHGDDVLICLVGRSCTLGTSVTGVTQWVAN